MNEWGDKDPEMEGWHHRGHPGHRGRMHGELLMLSVTLLCGQSHNSDGTPMAFLGYCVRSHSNQEKASNFLNKSLTSLT